MDGTFFPTDVAYENALKAWNAAEIGALSCCFTDAVTTTASANYNRHKEPFSLTFACVHDLFCRFGGS